MPIPQSPFGQDRQGSRHYADTKRCCAREATPKRSSDRRGESPPLQGRPVRRQDVDAGAKLAPQRKSEDLYYRSFCCECMCSGERFPGCARQGQVCPAGALPLISDPEIGAFCLYSASENCQRTRTAGLFALRCTIFPCNTQSSPAEKWLAQHENSSLSVTFSVFRFTLENSALVRGSVGTKCAGSGRNWRLFCVHVTCGAMLR